MVFSVYISPDIARPDAAGVVKLTERAAVGLFQLLEAIRTQGVIVRPTGDPEPFETLVSAARGIEKPRDKAKVEESIQRIRRHAKDFVHAIGTVQGSGSSVSGPTARSAAWLVDLAVTSATEIESAGVGVVSQSRCHRSLEELANENVAGLCDVPNEDFRFEPSDNRSDGEQLVSRVVKWHDQWVVYDPYAHEENKVDVAQALAGLVRLWWQAAGARGGSPRLELTVLGLPPRGSRGNQDPLARSSAERIQAAIKREVPEALSGVTIQAWMLSRWDGLSQERYLRTGRVRARHITHEVSSFAWVANSFPERKARQPWGIAMASGQVNADIDRLLKLTTVGKATIGPLRPTPSAAPPGSRGRPPHAG